MELVNASLPHPFYILQSLSDRAFIMLFLKKTKQNKSKSKTSSHYTIITLQSEEVFYRYFMVDSSYTFSKNLQFDYLFLEIFRLQVRKGTISTHGLQPWSISAMATNNDKRRTRLALRDASSVMPEIDPRWSRVADFSSLFPSQEGHPLWWQRVT